MSGLIDAMKSAASRALRPGPGRKSWTFPEERERCLVLFLQRMGDAVIASGFVNALHRQYPEMPIDILGLSGLRTVCSTFASFQDYFDFNFPLYAHHSRRFVDVRRSLEVLRIIRRRKYSYCINLVGDLRENLAGWMTGAKWHIAPVWAPEHPFALKITPGSMPWMINCGIDIPVEHRNYYDALDYLAGQLGLGAMEWPQPRGRTEPRTRPTVALHPGSSHPSKRWEESKWKSLMQDLNSRGLGLILLGAPQEREALTTAFRQEISDYGIDVRTSDVKTLAAVLADMDLLVGMDSFSVHVAHAVGVPAVVLQGSSLPGIIDPPSSVGLSAGHLCDVFPCYYKYSCSNTEGEYRCCRGIETNKVVDAVVSVIQNGK